MFFISISSAQNGSFRFPFESTSIENKEYSWTAGLSAGAELNQSYLFFNSIYLSKKFENQNLHLEYTPGLLKEFSFQQDITFVENDSSDIEFTTLLSYKEPANFSYTYFPINSLALTVSGVIRTETFKEDVLGIVYSDSIYLLRQTVTESREKYSFSSGFTYKLNENFFGKILLNNIIQINSDEVSAERKKYYSDVKKSIGGCIGFQNSFLSAQVSYESINKYSLFVKYPFNLFDNRASVSIGYMSEKYDDLNYSTLNSFFSYSFKGMDLQIATILPINNFSNDVTFNQFINNKLRSLPLNPYMDKMIFTDIKIALQKNILPKTKIIDIQIFDSIFPTFADEYISVPFAEAKVVNTSNVHVTVKPSARIENLSKEFFFSPFVFISPGDTASIPFYAIIDRSYNNLGEQIAYVEFQITTDDALPDDEIRKPIIIKSTNAWNGKVSLLKYFVTRDYFFSSQLSRNILLKNKEILDTINNTFSVYYRVKLIYDEVFKNLMYVADPNVTGDRVQFPNETVSSRGGDCDDLSVLLSSLLESIGIETAFVDYAERSPMRHVNLLVNTGLSPTEIFSITSNDRKYFIRKNLLGEDEVWLPIETTIFTSFEDAWEKGAEIFYNEAIENFGLVNGSVFINDVY